MGGPAGSGYRPSGWGAGDRETINQFETSLPIRYVCAVRGGKGKGKSTDFGIGRLDWEAVMAYVLLPPAGGVLLLIMEHKSDYVRYVVFSRSL